MPRLAPLLLAVIAAVAASTLTFCIMRLGSGGAEKAQMTLRGIALGSSVKALLDSSDEWQLSDAIVGSSEDQRLGSESVVSIRTKVEGSNNKPLVEVLGDSDDINHARVARVMVGYVNYDRAGITKADLERSTRAQWGAPDHTAKIGATEDHTWLNRSKGELGRATFDVADSGARATFILIGNVPGSHQARRSEEKAQDEKPEDEKAPDVADTPATPPAQPEPK